MIKIASFNVNSIKARLPNLLAWLQVSNPDIVLLQELKCLEENFPLEEISDAGYNCAIVGQKTYNGVAILSKFKIEDVVKSLPMRPTSKTAFSEQLEGGAQRRSGVYSNIHEASSSAPTDQVPLKVGFGSGSDGEVDEQARYIEAVISIRGQAIRVASIYVPNGGGEIRENETLESSEKFRYKLNFFERLNSHFSKLLEFDEIQIFGGDFNVAVEETDVFDAKNLDGTVCFHPLERQKFRSILNLGLADSYRACNQQNQAFTWWDYRAGGWQHNKGLRIDYLLTSPRASDKIISATIEDKGVRDQEKASDHCPVCVEIKV